MSRLYSKAFVVLKVVLYNFKDYMWTNSLYIFLIVPLAPLQAELLLLEGPT